MAEEKSFLFVLRGANQPLVVQDRYDGVMAFRDVLAQREHLFTSIRSNGPAQSVLINTADVLMVMNYSDKNAALLEKMFSNDADKNAALLEKMFSNDADKNAALLEKMFSNDAAKKIDELTRAVNALDRTIQTESRL